MKKLALVTGAYRGLGLETCIELAKLDYEVILTARKNEGKLKAEELQHSGLNVNFHYLDLSDEGSIHSFCDWIHQSKGHVEVLVNNGAVLIDREDLPPKHKLMESFEINVTGAYLLCERLLPLMESQHYGRVVNVSSGMGQLSHMSFDYPAYRISKAALNAVTRIFHSRKKSPNILINSICPGWVRTDMGGPNAPGSIEEGVEGIVWAATLPEGGPSGGFFRKGEKLDW